MGLGLGWLRAAAQSYNYSYSKLQLGCNFQNNLKRWKVNCGWGLDGCARWRKITGTLKMELSWGVIFI